MKKWLDEEYEFRVEVVGFLQGDSTEHYCRNGEEVGDTYHCTYGSPVNGRELVSGFEYYRSAFWEGY